MAGSAIDELDVGGLEDVLGSELRAVLVDFWSPWCSPCRTLRPHLARLASEREIKWRFVAVDVEKHPEALETFGVQSLPTLVFMRGGVELHRFSGAELVSTIDVKLDELAS